MTPTTAHPDFVRFRALLATHGAGLADLDAQFVEQDGRHELVYVPFHHVEAGARLVIVGITPGPTQVRLAYESVGCDLRDGLVDVEILTRAKRQAAFGGPMRRNLDRMLDHFDLPRLIGAERATDLWREGADAIECISVIPHAAFKAGQMFAGPFAEVLSSPGFRRCFERDFVGGLDRLRDDAVFIALGPTPLDAIDWCIASGAIRPGQVLGAFAHPSAGAGSQIDVYPGTRAPHELADADPVRHRVASLRAAHVRLTAAVEALRGATAHDAPPTGGTGRPASAEVIIAVDAPLPEQVPPAAERDRVRIVEDGAKRIDDINGIHAFVTRGEGKGTLLRPHVHADGCLVVSPTRFKADYIRVPATEPIGPYLLKGLSLRMSALDAPTIGASLIACSSIRGWKG